MLVMYFVELFQRLRSCSSAPNRIFSGRPGKPPRNCRSLALSAVPPRIAGPGAEACRTISFRWLA